METKRWTSLMEEFAFADNLKMLQQISDYYGEKQRAYHNAVHIDDCLQKFDLVKSKLHHQNEVELAIWFHDIIYNPYKGDNERKSAEECESFLRTQNAEEGTIRLLFDLIMATKHEAKPKTTDEAYLMDIDLSILGSSPTEYESYCKKVRKEYSFVPCIIYKRKRRAIMQKFLDQADLYQTDYFREKYEMQARINIAAEITSLS